MIAGIFFILGAFSNRVLRGGNTARKLENWLSEKFPKREALIKKIISADLLNALMLLATLLSFTAYGAQSLLIVAAMWLGAQPTWGQYMASIAGDHQGKFTRNKIFDYIPNTILRKGGSQLLAGIGGFTVRGIFWGGLLSLSTLDASTALVGSSMGIIYFLSYKVSSLVGVKNFALAEIIFGGILWATLA